MARPTYPGQPDAQCRMAGRRVTFAPTRGTRGRRIVERKEDVHGRGGTVMKAVVVYESMYGNTHQIADAIGTGLADFDVAVVPVAEAGRAVLADADLVVVGGPTHVHGMTRASTRQAAAKAAQESGSGLTLEPDALEPGLREWLDSLGKSTVRAKAAAFDTRMEGPAAFTGRVQGRWPGAAPARVRTGRRAGELHRDQGEPPRSCRRRPGKRLGRQAGRCIRAGRLTRAGART